MPAAPAKISSPIAPAADSPQRSRCASNPGSARSIEPAPGCRNSSVPVCANSHTMPSRKKTSPTRVVRNAFFAAAAAAGFWYQNPINK